MYRATTPTHIFALPFDTKLVKQVQVTYSQFGKTVLQKTTPQCRMAGNEIRVDLTQQETLLFQPTTWVSIQLRIMTTDGKVLASRVEKKRPKVCLCEEVMA